MQLVRQQRKLVTSGAGVILLACLGCSSRPAAVQPPSYDPVAFADSLLERCDADGSGALSKQEAQQVPGLIARWSRYDSDKDGSVTREELESHVQEWVDRGDGLASVNCIVLLGNRQIGEVSVKLIPDESLQGTVHPAETVSDAKYLSFFVIPPELKEEAHRKIPGMQYGLYNVEVSHPAMKLALAPDSRGLDVGPNDQAGPIRINVERQ